MALNITMSQPKDLPPLPEVEEIEDKPLSQWHRQLLEQANKPPVSHKHWPTQSQARVEPCRGYDWPDKAI